MIRPSEATWSNPKVLAIVAVVFLCGAAVGSAITRGVLRRHSMPNSMDASVVMEHAHQQGVHKLSSELKLNDAQQREIAKILDDYGKFYQNIDDEREDVAEQGRKHILETLTPEQRTLFNKYLGHGSS